jgi:AraC family transcriptional regulator of adaptative response / DNA-3-methyladenine glycosylase II
VRPDDDTCYRALVARDARLDGLFFVGVATTGIYCRPVCRARTPGRGRCRFFATASEAEHDGFRACFRCRPELAPGSAPHDAVPRLVASAVRRIGEGALNDVSVEALARSLGVSGRHLHRAVVATLGVSPVELAQTQRLAFAKRLLHDSSLGVAEIAFASGFRSVRRFNSAFRSRFGRCPSEARRTLGRVAGSAREDAIRLRLDFRPPLAWSELLRFLAMRAIPGVEHVEDGVYRRTVTVGGRAGWIRAAIDEGRGCVQADVSASLVGALVPLAARLRHLLDLDARPSEIDALLAQDPLFRPRVRATPGRRVPGAFDGFEAAARAVLGQQVTVKGATTLAARLVARFGVPFASPFPDLHHLFPEPSRLAAASVAEVSALGMPGARARALIELARAVRGGLELAPGAPVEPTLARLGQLPGFGDWTKQYVALRALGWPDAFPAGDLGVLAALGVKRPRDAIARAEGWRPWRAYATLHLWSSLGTP